MTFEDWPCPRPGGGTGSELAVRFDRDRPRRLLVLPALFDEANRMRRLTIEVLRRLDAAGIDGVLPDLPGCNESLVPLEACGLDDWRAAASAAVERFRPSHVLAVRGGGLMVPPGLPGWLYGPVKGTTILRQMLRARVLSARESGREESLDALLATGLEEGIALAGHAFGPQMIADLQAATPPKGADLSEIEQDLIGGSPLWLRAEPDEDRAQADALAAVLAVGMLA